MPHQKYSLRSPPSFHHVTGSNSGASARAASAWVCLAPRPRANWTISRRDQSMNCSSRCGNKQRGKYSWESGRYQFLLKWGCLLSPRRIEEYSRGREDLSRQISNRRVTHWLLDRRLWLDTGEGMSARVSPPGLLIPLNSF